MIKKVLCLILCLCLCFAMTACSSNTYEGKTFLTEEAQDNKPNEMQDDKPNVVPDESSLSEIDSYLDSFMAKYSIPAMSVMVFKTDEILYESYLGKADIENNIALTEEHIFLIASVSKTITATALMQLYDAGLFELDDPINDYLDFDVRNPYYNTPITFRMLLTHTSSIADSDVMDELYYYNEDSPVELAYFMEQYFSVNGKYYDDYQNFYDFEPGSEHEYSNIGSALIGVLVENLSGQDFNDYCKENIFELGMSNTYWKLEEINVDSIVRPYDYDLTPLDHYTFTDYPNGGLRTNGRDLMKFYTVFCSDGMSNGHQILSAETVQEMLQSQIPDIDPSVGLHFFKPDDKSSLWGHDGGESGVSTNVLFDPNTGIGVIILANLEDIELERLTEYLYDYGLNLSGE